MEQITCADVSARSLEISRPRFPQLEARHVELDGPTLPFEQTGPSTSRRACSIRSRMRACARPAQLRRVTRKCGLLVIFEHNPLNPLTALCIRPYGNEYQAARVDVARRIAESAMREGPKAG